MATAAITPRCPNCGQPMKEFRLVAAIPLYLSFVFGFIRDTWNPFGMRDRGFMLLFGATSAGL